MATKKFKCKVCGYVHEGDKAPDVCPICGAPASDFEEVKSKKGLDTNSNVYTFIYATLLVVVVALVLALTSALLKSQQEENVRLDEYTKTSEQYTLRGVNFMEYEFHLKKMFQFQSFSKDWEET